MTETSEQIVKPVPTKASRRNRVLLSTGLTLICIFVGYGFYQMNHHDWLNAIFFTVGLSGIMLSVLRRTKNPS